MGDEIKPVEKAEPYRWRAAVSPYRPPGLARIRSRKPLPGQMVLPGMDWGEEPSPAGEGIDTEAAPPDSVQARDRGQATPPRLGPACPNCGSTEFDDDGDCIRCWEPGVVPSDTQAKAREG